MARISQTVGIIGQARGFMNRAQLLLLYNTMVLPHLQYCLINWGNFQGDHNLGLRNGLLSLQKRLVRIICGSHRISHADPLFAELGTLKVDDLYTQAVRMFAFKAARGMLPGGMASMVSKVNHGYNTRRARSNFFIDRSDGRSLKSIAPRVWGFLSEEMRSLPSIATFKERSKGGLLAPYSLFACDVSGCRSSTAIGPSGLALPFWVPVYPLALCLICWDVNGVVCCHCLGCRSMWSCLMTVALLPRRRWVFFRHGFDMVGVLTLKMDGLLLPFIDRYGPFGGADFCYTRRLLLD